MEKLTFHHPSRSPSPPRSNINSAYYRQVSSAPKYGTYANSAVASVSASAIYGHTANPGGPSAASGHPGGSGGGYHYNVGSASNDVAPVERTSKPVYLTQSLSAAPRSSYNSTLAAERDRAAAAVAAQQRAAMAAAAASAPPAAHGGGGSGFRSASILAGYPRTVAYTVSSSAPAPSGRLSQAPQQQQQQQGQQQPNGSVRYYTQREV